MSAVILVEREEEPAHHLKSGGPVVQYDTMNMMASENSPGKPLVIGYRGG